MASEEGNLLEEDLQDLDLNEWEDARVVLKPRRAIVFGSRVLPSGNPMSYKEFIKRPIQPFLLDLSGEARSHRPGCKPHEVRSFEISETVLDIIEKLPDQQMLLHAPGPAASLLQSEASTNGEMNRSVFEPINQILAQFPDSFYRQYSIRSNPLATDPEYLKRESLEGGMSNAGNNKLQPDNEVMRCFDEKGEVDPRDRSILPFEGKRWAMFARKIADDAVIKSGVYRLARAYTKCELSPDGVSSIHQLIGYMNDRKLRRGVLYTLVVLWVLEVLQWTPLIVRISEPFPYNCINPSVMQVVLAITCEALEEAKEMDRQLRAAQIAGTSGKGADEGADENGGGSGGENSEGGNSDNHSSNPAPPSGPGHTDTSSSTPPSGPTSASQQEPRAESAAPGDDILSKLEDVRPAHLGNTLVRFGKLDEESVAAKIAPGHDDDWMKELENEAKVLDDLAELQGRVIPKKLYAGPVHGGRDRLLVTRLVEGHRLDQTQVTPAVVKSARKALSEIHNLGFTHGDIESRNIVVDRSGSCVFVDLGRAKRAKGRDDFASEKAQLEATLRCKW